MRPRNRQNNTKANTKNMSNDGGKPSVGKRGGEFLILAIYLFGDVWEFWNINHVLCLFLAGIGIFALIWYDDALNHRQLTILAAVLVVVAVGIDWVTPPIPAPPEAEVLGTLQPGNRPTPANGCDHPFRPDVPPLPSNALKILIGDNAFVRTSTDNGKFPVIRIGKCDVVRMSRTNNGLAVDADLYNIEDKHIAHIENNQLQVLTSEKVSAERKGDLGTLLIMDGDGKELLFVDYINAQTIRIRGIFSCPGHKPVIIQGNETIRMSGSCMVNEFNSPTATVWAIE
jgi:hypothetical protein